MLMSYFSFARNIFENGNTECFAVNITENVEQELLRGKLAGDTMADLS